jgi:tetratricopeptide (TPR) repeat protein
VLRGTPGIGVRGLFALLLAQVLAVAPGVVHAQAPPAGGQAPAAGTPAPSGGAGDEAAARAAYEKGTSAYALGDFAEAAKQYEAAFRLKLDPALLYNAAQAHRRANNRTRAIELYENLLRLFPNAPNRDVARQHLDELKKAAPPPAAGVAPGAVVPPPASTPPPTPAAGALVPPPIPTFAPGSGPAPAVGIEQASGAPGPRPLWKKPWFWGAVAGVVVLGVVTAVAVSAGDDPAAMPSWGRVGTP